MRRGFKAEAERLALSVRTGMDLTPTCRLDPVALAALHQADVVPLSALIGVSEDHRKQLMESDTAAFSGAVVFREDRKLVVVNDAHTPERQANTISHEIAHLLLEHPPGPAFGEFSRTLTKEIEQEADWLAGCLLVPGVGIAATMELCGDDLGLAASQYAVSLELMRWRHNVARPRTTA